MMPSEEELTTVQNFLDRLDNCIAYGQSSLEIANDGFGETEVVNLFHALYKALEYIRSPTTETSESQWDQDA